MTRNDCYAPLQTLLAANDLTALAGNVRLFEDAERDHQGNKRATLEIGYVGDKGRFKLTAVSNYPSLDDVAKAFCERNDIASTIDMGVRAMPEAIRPDLPTWVGEKSQAKRIQADMARARGAAKTAIYA